MTKQLSMFLRLISIVKPSFNISQIINEPVHLLGIHWSNFHFSTLLVMHSGVDPSLHLNYQHQIVFFWNSILKSTILNHTNN